jgi:GNAT superfamily N-acetyltransferase
MDQEYSIIYVDKPEEGAWETIGRGLEHYNEQYAGDSGFQRLCFVLQGPGGEVAGGAVGEIYWDWFHLDLLWLQEDLRGKGHGRALLKCMEDEARRRGAKHVFLDTFSFQAPRFYTRLGYEVFGELPGFPPGHKRYFLKREL